MAGKWHSKLTPHLEAIRAWRKAGKPYREISRLLLAEKGVQAHPDTINSFILTRWRAAKAGKQMAELPEPEQPPAKSDQPESASESIFEPPPATPPQPKPKKYNLPFD